MKKLTMIEKCKLIATVLKSDLTPEEKAEKLSIYIREKNISEAYVSANMLRSTVHNISHLHKPSIENIF